MRCARGVTRVEVTACVVMLLVVGVSALVVFSVLRTWRFSAMEGYDATQVRGIQQAMEIWASQNNGEYPLPSVIDAADATVGGEAESKNTTANIMSMLVYTGGVSPAGLVSPAECNPRIRVYEGYSFDMPASAVRPSDALWDPSFSADFTAPGGGNVSYAHIPPVGARRALWRGGRPSSDPIVGNRGPEVASITRDRTGKVVPRYVLAKSLTFLIHGGRHSWEGDIAYSDGHVNFETRVDPAGTTYKDAAGKSWTDCLFYDEPDDAVGTNAFMGIWTKAGSTNAAFKGIWD